MLRLYSILCALIGLAHSNVHVDTQWGPIRGHTVTLHTNLKVDSFQGIPFAAPPLGDLRFRAPQDPTPWTETFEADTFGDACEQGGGIFDWTHPQWRNISEDCLNLNIYAPHDKSGAPYAVMVWFHGGAYSGSGNIMYPGHFLAMRDVIVVIPNYRLGNIGFISTEDENAWGNWGMLDQVKSLEFVRDNIGLFGGDPNRVTIFGQSAGGSSASLHMFSPLSTGLFHRVIAQSGCDQSIWAVNWPNQNPANYTRQVAENLNCTTEDNAAMIDCLRQVPAKELRKARFFCKDGHFCLGMAPVIDHPGGFLPRLPHHAREDGQFNQADLMSGILSEDGSLYTISFMPETLLGGLNRTEFLDLLRNRLVWYFEPRFTPKQTEDMFQAMAFYYTPWPHIHDEEKNRMMMNNITTDVGFGTAMDSQVKNHVTWNPNTYEYIMGFRSANWSEVIPEWMGVPHQGDLPYVWGYPLMKLDDAARNDSLLFFDVIDWNQDDIDFAEFVQTLWTNFAKTGNPTPEPVERPFGGGPITWDAFGDELNYINMYRDVTMEKEYRQKNHAFWTEYMRYITQLNPIPEFKDGVHDDGGEPNRLRSEETLDAMIEFLQMSLENKDDYYEFV